jgi:tRNA (cytidine32/uridine32-2'-O)-methyltransferase
MSGGGSDGDEDVGVGGDREGEERTSAGTERKTTGTERPRVGSESPANEAPDVAIAVVDAKTPGNVGTVARSMKNFGLSDLLLVDPPSLDPDGEAYGMAGHAREDVLPAARELSFDELVAEYHTIGCTAITNEDETSHVRYPALTPADLTDRLAGVEGPHAMVFGRERVGLTNEELARLDELCSIPASADYPVLNLGQAATVVCYELRRLTVAESQHPGDLHETADPWRVEGLHEEFADFLAAINHPREKRHKARRLFRRVVGRADPTGREATTLRGLLRRAGTRIEVALAEPGGDDDVAVRRDEDGHTSDGCRTGVNLQESGDETIPAERIEDGTRSCEE